MVSAELSDLFWKNVGRICLPQCMATFLVLVRKARAVRVDDSLGPWLYGVSRRVAARERATSLRRRARRDRRGRSGARRSP